MTFMSTPAARPKVAAPCRRSCSRMGGRPARSVSRWKQSVIIAGCRFAYRVGESVAGGVVPGADGELLTQLPGAVGAHGGDGDGVEADACVAVAGLRGVDHGVPAVLHDLPAHGQGFRVE